MSCVGICDALTTIVRLLSSMASAKEISQYLKRFSQLDAKHLCQPCAANQHAIDCAAAANEGSREAKRRLLRDRASFLT